MIPTPAEEKSETLELRPQRGKYLWASYDTLSAHIVTFPRDSHHCRGLEGRSPLTPPAPENCTLSRNSHMNAFSCGRSVFFLLITVFYQACHIFFPPKEAGVTPLCTTLDCAHTQSTIAGYATFYHCKIKISLNHTWLTHRGEAGGT